MLAPGLYPSTAPRSTESRAEESVHAALKKRLPKTWFAWHSVRLRDRNNVDAEADFVVVDPDHGLLVLEVKGGEIEQRDGRWLQNGRTMKHDPRMQALGFATKLEWLLQSDSVEMPAWCVASCFADTEFDNDPSQGDLRDAVLGRQDLAWLDRAMTEVLKRGLPTPRPVSARTIEAIHRIWGDTWVPRITLGRKEQRREEERVRLDEQQLLYLDGVERNDRVLVLGGAGTGKTLLATEAARRAAARGKRTLMLCFTEPLVLHLRRELEGAEVRVESIRRYAAEIARAAGYQPPPAGPTASATERDSRDPKAPSWSDISGLAAGHIKDRFDVVVLDEAQDFGADDWLFADALSEGGALWAFADTAQSFWSHRPIEASLFQTTVAISRSYRNPPALRRVAEACGAGRPDPAAVREAIDTKELQLFPCPTTNAAADKVVAVVQAMRGEGLPLSDIAVVSLRGQTAQSAAFAALEASGLECVRADDPRAGEALVADTFLRFKGLERPAIVITDLDLVTDKREVRLHIALTRALTMAVVVASRDALRKEPVLSAGLPE